MVPERWHQTASSTLPNDRLEQEVSLVRYTLQTSEHGASLEILAMNSDEMGNAVDYHLQPAFGIADWKVVEGPTELTLGGVPAQRMRLEGTSGDDGFGKEVFVVQRGPREFHFVGLYSLLDPNARQQIQRAVESVIWKEVP